MQLTRTENSSCRSVTRRSFSFALPRFEHTTKVHSLPHIRTGILTSFPFSFFDAFALALGTAHSMRISLTLKPLDFRQKFKLKFLVATTPKICTRGFSNLAHAIIFYKTSTFAYKTILISASPVFSRLLA